MRRVGKLQKKVEQALPKDQQNTQARVDPGPQLPFLSFQHLRMSRLQVLLLGLLFLFSFFMRCYELDRFPRYNQTSDEYHYPWVGLSLLSLDKPQSWSFLPAYDDLHLRKGRVFYRNAPFLIVSPAFDHPPLYSLLAGGFAWLTGARSMELPLERYHPEVDLYQPTQDYIGKVKVWDVELGRLRWLSVILFAWSFLMLFAVVYRAYSYPVAFWTMLFYSCITHIIIHQRLSVTENLLTPLLLTNIFLMQSYLGGQISKRLFMALTIILSAMAPLAKLIAIVQPAIILYLLMLARKRREALYPLIGGALGVMLYMLYGASYGWHEFVSILYSQSARFNGFDSILYIILKPQLFQIDNFNYILWIGWFTVFGAVYASRGATLMVVPLLYFCSFVFFAQSNGIWGWHMIVFYPFLCLGLGLLAYQGSRGDNPMAFLLIVTMFIPYFFQNSFLANQKNDAMSYRYAYLFVTAILLGVLNFLPINVRRWSISLASASIIGWALCSEVHKVWTMFP